MIKEKFEIAKKKLETKSYQESKILLKEIIAEEPNHFGSHFLLGSLCGLLNEKEMALKYLYLAKDIDPSNLNTYFNIGLIYKKIKEPIKAKKYLEKVLNIEANHIGSLCALGQLHEEENDLIKAKNKYEKAINCESKNKLACQLYGKILLRLNEHEKGLKFMKISSGFIRYKNKKIEMI